MLPKIKFVKHVGKIIKRFKMLALKIKKYFMLQLHHFSGKLNATYQEIKRKKLLGVLTICIFFIAWVLLGSSDAFLFAVFFIFLFFKLDRRILLVPAIILLASCPVFLHYKQDSKATNAAVFAYYLLMMVFMLLVFDFGGYNFFKKIIIKLKHRQIIINKWLKKSKTFFSFWV